MQGPAQAETSDRRADHLEAAAVCYNEALRFDKCECSTLPGADRTLPPTQVCCAIRIPIEAFASTYLCIYFNTFYWIHICSQHLELYTHISMHMLTVYLPKYSVLCTNDSHYIC